MCKMTPLLRTHYTKGGGAFGRCKCTRLERFAFFAFSRGTEKASLRTAERCLEDVSETFERYPKDVGKMMPKCWIFQCFSVAIGDEK